MNAKELDAFNARMRVEGEVRLEEVAARRRDLAKKLVSALELSLQRPGLSPAARQETEKQLQEAKSCLR